jgi:hypothetical protein
MRIVAEVLAKYRDSEAGASIGSVVAMITCDLSDAFRKADPEFEYLEYWNIIEDYRRVERARVAAWIADARERMATK